MTGFYHYAILIAANFCISMCILVDTSTWWIRALSASGNMGRSVSRTNIYSYSGRFFAFTYMTSLSLLVDTGSTTREICMIVGTSLLIAVALHMLLLNRSRFSQSLLLRISRVLSLDGEALEAGAETAIPYARTISRSTAAASFFLCMALGAPYVLASLVPDFRLTIANIGQILNSIAMIFILFYVDQSLYRAWDENRLEAAVRSYNTGRLAGIGAAGAVMIIASLAIALID